MNGLAILLATVSLNSAPYDFPGSCAEKVQVLYEVAQNKALLKSFAGFEPRYRFRLTDDVPSRYHEKMIGCVTKGVEMFVPGYHLSPTGERDGGHEFYILERE